MDVQIQKVESEIVLTDGVGTLSPQEVQKLVAIVLEQLEARQRDMKQQQRDTAIENRVYIPGI